MKRIILMMLVLALLLAGCGSTGDGEMQKGDVTSEAIAEDKNQSGQDASDSEATSEEPYVLQFSGVTLDGETLTSECFANSKLTMINVWATFCGPCINEMPDLGEIAKEYDSLDFQLIGIISDVIEGEEGDTFTEAEEIVKETGADYKHLLLNEELYMNLVGASDSVPTTYFFNSKGEYLGYLVGAQSKEVWKQIIDSLLAENN